jgi:hypothetical protein
MHVSLYTAGLGLLVLVSATFVISNSALHVLTGDRDLVEYPILLALAS